MLLDLRYERALILAGIGALLGVAYLILRARLVREWRAGRLPDNPLDFGRGVKTGVLLLALGAALLGAYLVTVGNWRWAFQCLGHAAALGGAWFIMRRLELGWIIDANGERQKVISRDSHGPVFKPTSHEQRRQEEVDAAKPRRRNLALYWIGGVLLGAVTLFFWNQKTEIWPWTGLVAFALLLNGSYFAALEILYRTGFQHMKGAMVFDPVPIRPGADRANAQMAHGGARPANEDEVHAASTGAGKKSSVHDRQF